MANGDHVALIAKSVAEWNEWRRRVWTYEPGRIKTREKPDLRGWPAEELRVFDSSRFVATYLPTPDEIPELLAQQARGALSPEEESQGWKTLEGANLYEADLSDTNLSRLSLSRADLRSANLSRANLAFANLSRANLAYADLSGATLHQTDLSGAILEHACLQFIDGRGANLAGANLTRTNLAGADLANADLEAAVMSQTDLSNASISGARVYGVAAWDVSLNETSQYDLIITRRGQPSVTVDNLAVAQFMYLLLNNEHIRGVLDTVTAKAVLILGRFSKERKTVLDELRGELRNRGYLPILFDFTVPSSRDLTETISTLAHIARFIVADLTDARSVAQELGRIVPNLPSVPVQPILLAATEAYALFEHFRRFPWVLPVVEYTSLSELRSLLYDKVIAPAETKVLEMRPR